MLNNRIIAVFKREVKERVISKGFIIMTILLPVFMFGLIGIQVLLMKEDSTKFNVTVISESNELTLKLENELRSTDAVKEKTVNLLFSTMNKDEFKEFLKSKKQEVLDEKITGVLYVPESALKDKKIEYYSKTPQNRRLSE
ncbi:MAG: ABC transporter permease, partial [Melioribacter sp.]|nr:ABC transporter permease [Melioribacter sp.]